MGGHSGTHLQNLRAWEPQTGGLLQIPGQPGFHSKFPDLQDPFSEEKKQEGKAGEEMERGGGRSALQLGEHSLSDPFFPSGLCVQPSTQQPTLAIFACRLPFFKAKLPRGRCAATGSSPCTARWLGLSAGNQAWGRLPSIQYCCCFHLLLLFARFSLTLMFFPPAAQQALLISVKGKPMSFFQIIIV